MCDICVEQGMMTKEEAVAQLKDFRREGLVNEEQYDVGFDRIQNANEPDDDPFLGNVGALPGGTSVIGVDTADNFNLDALIEEQEENEGVFIDGDGNATIWTESGENRVQLPASILPSVVEALSFAVTAKQLMEGDPLATAGTDTRGPKEYAGRDIPLN